MWMVFRSTQALPDGLPPLRPQGLVAAAVGLPFLIASPWLLGLAWHRLLRRSGIDPGWRNALRWYVRALPGKYVPGNVAQHGMKALSALNAGVPAAGVARAALGEIGSQAAVGCAVLAAGWLWPLGGDAGALGCAGAILLAAAIAVHVTVPTGAGATRDRWESIAIPAAHVAYLLLWGAVGTALFLLFAPLTLQTAPRILWALTVGWAAGFLAPGAPGGLGVREAVSLAALADVLPEAVTIPALVAGRLLCIAADLIAAGSAFLFRDPRR